MKSRVNEIAAMLFIIRRGLKYTTDPKRTAELLRQKYTLEIERDRLYSEQFALEQTLRAIATAPKHRINLEDWR